MVTLNIGSNRNHKNNDEFKLSHEMPKEHNKQIEK